MAAHPIRIGTRGSPLALWQAETVKDLLHEKADLPVDAVEIVKVTTSGDKILDRRLADFGGKGLFTKELDNALADGSIDCAVHSLKDVPTFLPDAFVLAAYLTREDPRDALVAPGAKTLTDLPEGARVGTASLRREAMLRAARPDLDVSLIRGNVGTRLKKLADGAFDATLLAYAGLKRLGLQDEATGILDPETFIPAVGQGIVAVQIRSSDHTLAEQLRSLNDRHAETAARTERAFLAKLDGSCRSPIAGHARLADGTISFSGMLMTQDGVHHLRIDDKGGIGDGEALGARAAQSILNKAPPELLAVLEEE